MESLPSVDPHFPASPEEVEASLKAAWAMIPKNEGAQDNDEITPETRFSHEEMEVVNDTAESAAIILRDGNDVFDNGRFKTQENDGPGGTFFLKGFEYFPSPFDNILITGFLRRMTAQTGVDCSNEADFLLPRQEIIVLRAAIGDLENVNAGCMIQGGASDERLHILLHYVNVSSGKPDQRAGFIELCAVIPESVATRLDKAIKRNRKFRILLMRELIQGTFPFLENEEDPKYAALRFNYDFTYVGSDVMLRHLPDLPSGDRAYSMSAYFSSSSLFAMMRREEKRYKIIRLIRFLVIAMGISLAAGYMVGECNPQNPSTSVESR